MAINKYKIEVVRVFQYEIEIDANVWTNKKIAKELNVSEGSDYRHQLAKALAEDLTDKGATSHYMEGFGFVKQNFSIDGELIPIQSYRHVLELNIPDEKIFAKGLKVNIISHSDQIESKILTSEIKKSDNNVVVTNNGREYFSNGKSISNFTLIKTGQNLYLVDNGRIAKVCKIKHRNLIHFELALLEQANFFFTGNTKHLNAILDEADFDFDKKQIIQ